jgi:hypothetical protein
MFWWEGPDGSRVLTMLSSDYGFLLEGFGQKRAYAQRAATLVDPAIADRMTELAAAVNVAGPRVVVFNPLPWHRDGAVDVQLLRHHGSLSDARSSR